MNKVDTSKINVKALLEVIDYLESSERQSYEEYLAHEYEADLANRLEKNDVLNKELYENPNIAHIYAVAMRLKDSVIVI